jgi:hypothetical protein
MSLARLAAIPRRGFRPDRPHPATQEDRTVLAAPLSRIRITEEPAAAEDKQEEMALEARMAL